MAMISSFLASPWPTAALIFAIALFFGALILGLEVVEQKHIIARKKAFWAGRRQEKSPNAGSQHLSPTDRAAEQLRLVSTAYFSSRALLNQSEAKVYLVLSAAVQTRNPNWQVMAQVSVGEFLASPSKDAFLAVNSKRVDFALMDENWRVRHAIEYQGAGHHVGSSAAGRDAVKREALRKAGIGYHEVIAGHTTPPELRALIAKLVPDGRRDAKNMPVALAS